MTALRGLLAAAGLAVVLAGCAANDYGDLSFRKEFGCPLPNHHAYYHHMTHHWHGVCCYAAGHECGVACADCIIQHQNWHGVGD